MAQPPFKPPDRNETAFNCPHCGAYATQLWSKMVKQSHPPGEISGWSISTCARCENISLWKNERMIFPLARTAPTPNSDLPADLLADYEEASDIVGRSPRGAAALLRLAIQKLCKHLGEPGKNINDDVASLVKKGLNPTIQKALDIVRVIGNDAVHPGEIDLNDTPEIAVNLFGLVNIIADDMISRPKHIEQLYASLPEGKRQAIEKRDQPK